MNTHDNRRCRVGGRVWLCAGVLLSLGVLVVSCKSGKDYARPALGAPAAYKSATDKEKAQPGLDLEWWRLFGDADLSALAEEALAANQGLKAAMARVAEARASAASVRSQFFPVVTMNPSMIRSRRPGTSTPKVSEAAKISEATALINGVSRFVGQTGALLNGTTTGTTTGSTGGSTGNGSQTSGAVSGATTTTLTQIPFDLSYEIDFWGRVSRSYEAAQAQTQASVCDLEVVRQTLLADVAQNYFNLRLLDAQAAILDRNLAMYQEQVDLTGQQLKAGMINETNLFQARTQLESTKVQMVDFRRQRADLEHALAVLLGKAPAEFSLKERSLDNTPLLVPAGLPSDLLRRRPDVAEAEQNLAAACAQVGVAEANFFPVVKLTGAAGFQTTDTQHILDWQNRIFSLGPSVTLPIFQGGQLKASLRQAKARYEELEANYRNAVLGAYNDVENALTDLHMRADEAGAQQKAVDAARGYLQLTQLQYKNGFVNYLQVIDAERTLLTNELSAVQILNERMVSTVLLIKALGGGWEAVPAVSLAAQDSNPESTPAIKTAEAPGKE